MTTTDENQYKSSYSKGNSDREKNALRGRMAFYNLSNVTIDDISHTAVATGNVSQAISALVALGYTQSQAALAVAKLDTDADVQTLIKQALRLIAGGKV
jgi:Holliday junction DNA helicase RuvA